MAPPNHNFLFASLGSKPPLTTRKVHIRRLYDIFQFCISKRDLPRAKSAWSILVRCKEIDWAVMWTTGLLLLGEAPDDELSQSKVEYLKTMMLQNTDERASILQELVLRLILRGQYKNALNELELYLPAFPFQDDPVLHTYSGLLSIYLAQSSSEMAFDPILIRDAQSHLDQALTLDPDNVVAQEFSKSISELRAGRGFLPSQRDLSDEETDLDHGKDEDNEDGDGYGSPETPKAKKTRI